MDGTSNFLASGLTIILIVSAIQVPLGFVLGWFFCRRFSRPQGGHEIEEVRGTLNELKSLAGRLAEDVGRHASQVADVQSRMAHSSEDGQPQQPESLAQGLADINALNQRLQSELGAAEQKLEEQSRVLETHLKNIRIDPVTGLANRLAYDDELARRVAEHKRRGTALSVIWIHVDQYQEFRGSHDAHQCDLFQVHIAQVLQKSTRQMDLAARVGDGLFAVLLPATCLSLAYRAAERAKQMLAEEPFKIDNQTVKITFSGGAAEVAQDDEQERLVRRAGDAMKSAQADGGDRCYVHDGHKCLPDASTLPPPPEACASQPNLEYRGRASIVAAPSSEARTDPLTGLPSLRSFNEDMKRRLAQLKRFDTPLSLVLVDVDGLTKLNDRHGQETGDFVLRAVTQFLTTAMREMDLVARCQGGQFALTLPGTELPNAVLAAERIRKAIALCTLRLEGQEIRFTISAGVAGATPDDDTEALLKRTGAALSAAKATGGNRTHFHNGRRCATADDKSALQLA